VYTSGLFLSVVIFVADSSFHYNDLSLSGMTWSKGYIMHHSFIFIHLVIVIIFI